MFHRLIRAFRSPGASETDPVERCTDEHIAQVARRLEEALERGWWRGRVSAVGATDEMLLVVGPRSDARADEFRILGEALQRWQAARPYARHIWGLDDLLDGRAPRTPPIYLAVPYPTDGYEDCFEPVALAFVAAGTDCRAAGADLAAALESHHGSLAWLADPLEYSNLNR